MTLLIKNVQLVGGMNGANGADGAPGAAQNPVDIFVSGNKISAIGNFPNKKADTVLDGQGAYVSAGFIDANTASDHYLTLFNEQSQEDALRQGVTTIMGGMGGASLAPLLYGSLESIQKWGDISRVNVNWHTMAEFLNVMDRRPPAVNFGTLVGHATVRRAIVGEALRDLTKNELGVFVRTLDAALAEGAFGLSVGLGYVHARKTPYPELRTLAEVVKKHHGVFAVQLRHDAAGVKESVEEAIKLARETGVSVLINHFAPVAGAEKEYEEALVLMNDLPPEIDLHFDISPSTSSLAPLYTFLPEWAQTGGVAVMNATVNDEWLFPRIKKEMPEFDEENFLITHAPGSEFLVGRSLKEIKELYEVDDAREALLRLMQALQLKGSVLYKNLDAALIARAIASPRSLIGSAAPSVPAIASGEKHFKSDRTSATFAAFLALVEEQKLMPLADAVKKITHDAAKKFGIAGRGVIKEGAFADITCFRGSEVKFSVVNGRVAEKANEFQSVFPGNILRHS